MGWLHLFDFFQLVIGFENIFEQRALRYSIIVRIAPKKLQYRDLLSTLSLFLPLVRLNAPTDLKETAESAFSYMTVARWLLQVILVLGCNGQTRQNY